MTHLRVGILGAAQITPTALIEPAKLIDGVVITAIAARDPQRAAEFAAEHSIPTVYASYDELLADPEIDAVYIPTPNGLHGRWTIAALRAGKHVLCEKPFTANAAEAEEVADVAQATGKVVMEAFHYRYHPLFERTLEIIDSGEIGRVTSVDASMVFSIENDPDNVRWDLALAGGSLMDVGCYPLSWLRAVVREEPVVTGVAAHTFAPGIDGDMTVDVEFPSGVTGRAHGSMWVTPPTHEQRSIVTGDAGTLEVTHAFTPQFGNRLTITTADGVREESVTTESTYSFQLRAFAEAIELGTPVVTGPDEAVALMRVIDAAYEASGLGVRYPTAQPGE